MNLDEKLKETTENLKFVEYILNKEKQCQETSEDKMLELLLEFYFEYIWSNPKLRKDYPEPPEIKISSDYDKLSFHINSFRTKNFLGWSIIHKNFLGSIDLEISQIPNYSLFQNKVKNNINNIYTFFSNKWHRNYIIHSFGGLYSLFSIQDFCRLFMLQILGIPLESIELKRYWAFYLKTLTIPMMAHIGLLDKCYILKGNIYDE